jgi:hypothetical protein
MTGSARPDDKLRRRSSESDWKCSQQNKASKTVIPGRCEATNYDVQLHIGESRDSGSGAAHNPGMTPNIMGCISSQTLRMRFASGILGLPSDPGQEPALL